ncbi:MAG: undecaprenyl-diphosphate phosphatase [Clostridia bacterium]|nr:undecaprenyl-diphosphate phosphatase [Clostridia bacterium]
MLYAILLALCFGILEGVTEWLPVSSTGHIILLRHFLPLTLDDDFFELFEVVIQLGAMCAVGVLFFHTLWPFSKNKDATKRRATWALWGKILVATLPAAFFGLLFDDLIDRVLFNPLTVAVSLIAYGVLFLVIERRRALPRIHRVEDITYTDALRIGAFQVLSLIPGTSRSGATILGGLLLGISRPVSALFSFFLGLPTMAGAGTLKVAKFLFSGAHLSRTEWLILAVGTLTAFLLSLFALRFLTDFVRRHTFSSFGIYRILLGAAVLLTFIL